MCQKCEDFDAKVRERARQVTDFGIEMLESLPGMGDDEKVEAAARVLIAAAALARFAQAAGLGPLETVETVLLLAEAGGNVRQVEFAAHHDDEEVVQSSMVCREVATA